MNKTILLAGEKICRLVRLSWRAPSSHGVPASAGLTLNHLPRRDDLQSLDSIHRFRLKPGLQATSLFATAMLAFFLSSQHTFAAEHLRHVLSPVPTNTFSLDWVLTTIRTNNPSLKAADANWRAARQRAPQASAWEDPQAEFDFTAGRFVDAMQNSFPNQKLMVQQALPVTGKNRLRGHAASAEAAATAQELRRRKLDLSVQARIAYVRLANAYAQIDLNRKNATLLQQSVQITQSRYELGQMSQADLLNAETEAAKLDEDAFDFEQQISDQQSILNTLMNRPPESPLGRPVTSDIPVVTLSVFDLQQLALTSRPEILAAQNKIEAAKAKLKIAERDRIPEPNFKLEADRYNGASQGISEVLAGVSINLPWFNHKKYAAAIDENREMLEAARHDLEALQAQTLSMVRDQLKKIETDHHHYELYRDKVVPLARQTVEASRISYEANKSSFFELAMAQRNARETEAMQLQHFTDYQIAVAELEAIVSIPLEKIISTESSPKEEK